MAAITVAVGEVAAWQEKTPRIGIRGLDWRYRPRDVPMHVAGFCFAQDGRWDCNEGWWAW